jgi:hypothetical protein
MSQLQKKFDFSWEIVIETGHPWLSWFSEVIGLISAKHFGPGRNSEPKIGLSNYILRTYVQ